MLKITLLILIFIYVFYIIRKRRKLKQNHATPNLDELVRCENCDVYFSKNKAIIYKNLFFCSKKCRKQYEDKIRRDI